MLKPLEQFICDSCGEVIEKPEDGWVEWLYEKNEETGFSKNRGFKIVHHSPRSPLNTGIRGVNCYHYNNIPNRSDNHLTYFLGVNGLVELYAKLDPGEAFADEKELPMVLNLREYVNFMRRLTIPYYEEARKYWSDATNDGYFNGANEIWTFLPDNLRTLIEQYKEE